MSDDGAERWRRTGELLERALELPTAEAEALLARECGADEALAVEVRSLLAAHRRAGDGFLAESAAVAAAELLEAVEGAEAGAAPGDRVGAFRLIRELGRGGMGAVFLAERVEGGFEQQVAVKLLGSAAFSEEAQRRFRLERQILARLDHPGIAHLVDGGVLASGRTWFALELVDGVPIDRFCRERALPVRRRLELFLSVLEAVEYAHRSLVVHRDLKPANVLVTRGGEVKLLDFGIAKVLESEAPEGGATAQTLLRALTPQYAAPEQLRGEAVTTATDVYSLGVLLFELLTGRLPYRDPARLVRAVLELEPLAAPAAVEARTSGEAGLGGSPGELRRQLAGDLEAILAKALRKEAAERYPNVSALAADLRRYLDGRPVEARGDAVAYRAGRFLRRHRAAAAAAALVVLSLSGGLVAALTEARRAQREARKAEEVQAFLLRILSASDPAQAKGAAVTVREVLDAGAREIASGLAGEPEVADRALELVASVYLQLGEYEAALPLAERRVAARRERFGAGSVAVAEAELLSANILWDRGRQEDAGRLYSEAHEIFERAGDAESAAAREATTGVAASRRARGDLEGAEALQRRVVELARHAGGEGSAEALSAENSLAMTLGAAERFAESAAIFRRIVEADARSAKSDLPDALTHRYNLAVDLVRSGDWAGAQAVFATLVPAARRVLGAAHPRLAVALRWQAVLLDLEGASREALVPLAECLRIQTAAFGPGDAQLGWTRAVEAGIAARAGEVSEAESAATSALALLEPTVRPGDPALGLAWEGAARAHLATGRSGEALAAADRAVALRSGVARPGRSLAAALDLAAEAALAAGDPAGAIERGERSLAVWEASGQTRHPEAARARLHLAGALLARAGEERARVLLAVAAPIVEASFLPLAPERSLLTRLQARLRTGLPEGAAPSPASR